MRIPLLLVTAILLASCGSGSDSTSGGSGQGAGEWGIAASSNVNYSLIGQGANAFMHVVEFKSKSLRSLKSLSYRIEPKPGASAEPVHVSYSRQGLQRRNAIKAPERIQVPVVGLYAGYVNEVKLEFVFDDDSIELLTVTVVTPAYRNPALDSPTIIRKRQPGTDLGFNYIAMKSEQGSPVIIDTDGEVRWLGPNVPSGLVSTFQDQGFYVGSRTTTQFSRIELDGSITSITPARSGYSFFHHNIDKGRNGLLTEVSTTSSAASVIAELSMTSGFGREWDFGAILSAYMTSRGDNAALFVRDPDDWFHVNATTYRPSDNTLIASSRENFLIGIDYDTSEIKWILGDTTKYWGQFPSLQDKALVLQGPGDYPIGQHAVTITRDDLILVFNNGQNSSRQPVGAPAGMSRAYSTVSAYRIDPEHRTATQVWGFDYDQSIMSSICSSAYEASDGSLLIDYAYAANGDYVRIVGLNSAHQLVFDMQFPNTTALTSWNAMPVPLDDIRFD